MRRVGQRDEMTASSAMGVWRTAPVSLILKHFQEQRREEFCGALHLHVQEAAGVAGADHPQIRHLHQQLGPEVGNVVFAVVDVVLEGQQVRLLALLDLLHADQPRPVCGHREAGVQGGGSSSRKAACPMYPPTLVLGCPPRKHPSAWRGSLGHRGAHPTRLLLLGAGDWGAHPLHPQLQH